MGEFYQTGGVVATGLAVAGLSSSRQYWLTVVGVNGDSKSPAPGVGDFAGIRNHPIFWR
jgi:hypothetical protein